jgi:hypothetical protein
MPKDDAGFTMRRSCDVREADDVNVRLLIMLESKGGVDLGRKLVVLSSGSRKRNGELVEWDGLGRKWKRQALKI